MQSILKIKNENKNELIKIWGNNNNNKNRIRH